MSKANGLGPFALIAALILLLSWVQLDPADNGGAAQSATGYIPAEGVPAGDGSPTDVAVGPAGGPAARGPAQNVPGASGTGSGGVAADGGEGGEGGAAGQGATAAESKDCAEGKNAGATDKGVTADKIKLATTAVLDGPAKSLLAPSITGMKAVVDKVNRAGGICGRRLELEVKNDSFDASRGQQFIRNFISEDYFALPVVPSAEGLGAAIESGYIAEAGIPIVGTDGMRKEQYAEPWVWPVATSTVSTMRVMADYGHQVKSARTFAIVWDSKYKFGVEGRDAFKAQVEALGGTVVSDQPLDPESPSYASEVESFNQKCGNDKCDMVALLLLPETGVKWMSRRPAVGKVYTAGAQTLFTNTFATGCVQAVTNGVACNGVEVWTGYNPPIGSLAAQADVDQYAKDVQALDPGIDINNQFVEGAYLGMMVFVEALERVGPNLTRAALQQALDSMTFESDISSSLSWRTGNHAANRQARSFSIVVSQSTFTGWREESPFRADPAR